MSDRDLWKISSCRPSSDDLSITVTYKRVSNGNGCLNKFTRDEWLGWLSSLGLSGKGLSQIVGTEVLLDIDKNSGSSWVATNVRLPQKSEGSTNTGRSWFDSIAAATPSSILLDKLYDRSAKIPTDWRCPDCGGTGQVNYTDDRGHYVGTQCDRFECKYLRATRMYRSLTGVPLLTRFPTASELRDVGLDYTRPTIFTCGEREFREWALIGLLMAGFTNSEYLTQFSTVLKRFFDGVQMPEEYNLPVLMLRCDIHHPHQGLLNILPRILSHRLNLSKSITWMNISGYPNSVHVDEAVKSYVGGSYGFNIF